MADRAHNPNKPRRRRRVVRTIFKSLAFAVVTIATLVIVVGPAHLPIPGLDDESLIAYQRSERHLRASMGLPMPRQPDLSALPERLSNAGFSLGAPIFMRIFKREFELELWMQRDGVFTLFATYPICTWSGDLGPKHREGDRQAPEGIYTVDKGALNPNSAYHRSFNLGYPNAFDRSHGRTGSFLMVHGACASVGCFAMTDAQIDEIWAIVTAALNKGQPRFQVQVFPFRMTEDALAKRADHPAAPFWRTLKAGHDLFEATGVPPIASVCNRNYAFEPGRPGSRGDTPLQSKCPTAAAADDAGTDNMAR
jgi:murein L,D-transpeptidase YafK